MEVTWKISHWFPYIYLSNLSYILQKESKYFIMMYDSTLLKYNTEHTSVWLYLNLRQEKSAEQCLNLMFMVLSNVQISSSREIHHHE